MYYILKNKYKIYYSTIFRVVLNKIVKLIIDWLIIVSYNSFKIGTYTNTEFLTFSE